MDPKKKKGLLGLLAVIATVFLIVYNGGDILNSSSEVVTEEATLQEVDTTVTTSVEDELIHVDSETEESGRWDPRDKYADSILLPISHYRKLTEDDIAGLSRDELMFARAEIIASHGIRLANEQMHQGMLDKVWYVPIVSEENIDFETEFKSYELFNLDFLEQAVEKASGDNSNLSSSLKDNASVMGEYDIPRGITWWRNDESEYDIMFDSSYDDGYRAIMYVRGTDEINTNFPNDSIFDRDESKPNVVVSADGLWTVTFIDHGSILEVRDLRDDNEVVSIFHFINSDE